MDHFEPPESDKPAVPNPEKPIDDLDQSHTLAEEQARLEYPKRLSSARPKPKKKSLWAALIVLVVLLLAGSAYLLMSHHKTNKPVTKQTTAASVAPSSQSSSSTTTNYVSKGTDLNLSFDYPSNWTVTPPSGGNTDDQTITLNSPLTTITGADGKSVTGRVTVQLRPASAGLTELSDGKATSAQTSVQIAYTKPTASQYQYPYLIFIHLAGGVNPTAAFDEVLVSGTRQFAKDQSITDTSLTVDPIITASFYACSTSACISTGATPLDITNDTWTNDSLFQQTLALLESLQIN